MASASRFVLSNASTPSDLLLSLLNSSVITDSTFTLNNTLYDTSDKNSPVPLFSVSGPSTSVPNPRYTDLHDEQTRALQQLAVLDELIRDSPAGKTDTTNMEKRIVEGTPDDRCNVVVWVKAYHSLLTSPELEDTARIFWTATFTAFLTTMIASIGATYRGHRQFASWEANTRKMVQRLMQGYRFMGLPPTKQMVEFVLATVLRNGAYTNNEQQFLNLVRSPEMWLWGLFLTFALPGTGAYWQSQIEPWALAIPGAQLVKRFYDFIKDATGVDIPVYFSAATGPAAKAAVVTAANANTGRLLSGVAADKYQDTVLLRLNSLFNGVVQSQRLVPVIDAMMYLVKAMQNIRGLDITSRAVLDVVSEKLGSLRFELVGAGSVVQQRLQGTLSALQLSNVELEQIFDNIANLRESSYVLSKLEKMITNDAAVYFAPELHDKALAIMDRDEAYEWFRTRSEWVVKGGDLSGDETLLLVEAKARLAALRVVIGRTSQYMEVPLEFKRIAGDDQLAQHPRALRVDIMDSRPDTGGPGGYEFKGQRTYEVKWYSSRTSPNAANAIDGEPSSRPSKMGLLQDVRLIGVGEAVGAGGSMLSVFSPVLRSVQEYADGSVWCEIKSVDANGKEVYLRSMNTRFHATTRCGRCGTYFAQTRNVSGACRWINNATGLRYSGMHTTSETPQEPTPYDMVKGVKGSLPDPQQTIYDMEGLYNELERRAAMQVEYLGAEVFDEQVQDARDRFAREGAGRIMGRVEELVALETMYNMAQRTVYANAGRAGTGWESIEKTIDEWLRRFVSDKGLVLSIVV